MFTRYSDKSVFVSKIALYIISSAFLQNTETFLNKLRHFSDVFKTIVYTEWSQLYFILKIESHCHASTLRFENVAEQQYAQQIVLSVA